ncbi:hypothetical protein BSKO_07885 [Bryopsis sp. KO-2023]|nr:hypothetical protein BSKO_07885 [Bryopsis sp. KO-2023]
MFEGERGKVLQQSLKEFLDRPENRPLVEKQQRKEVKQAIAIKERIRELEFRNKVFASDEEAQNNIGPFLQNKILRRIVMCFANDEAGDFAKWAKNPRVISMLREAKKLLDEGRVLAIQVVKLQTDQLVAALNEHLEERRKGNDAYKRKILDQAMEHYTRALAIVNFVEAANPVDQEEIERNKVSVLLNMAAVHVEKQDFGAAIGACGEVLGMEKDNAKALMRRAKAHALRHDFEKAQADLGRVLELDPWNFEVHDELQRIAKLRAKGSAMEKATFKRMFC